MSILPIIECLPIDIDDTFHYFMILESPFNLVGEVENAPKVTDL